MSPGSGFDALGRAVYRDSALAVDLSSIIRPSAGQYKWITIYVAFARNSYRDVYDDNNQRHDLYHDEDASAGVLEGAPGSQGGAVRPVVTDNIVVADMLIDAASPMDTFALSTTRRERVLSAVDLKNRWAVVRTAVNEATAKVIPFASLGIADGSYAVLAQLATPNVRFVRSIGVETTQTGITLYLYHDRYPYPMPVLGSPTVKIGSRAIGTFIVGDRESIEVDLFIYKEGV